MAQKQQTDSTAQTEKITPRRDDFAAWYQDVIRQASLAESAEVVKGCMVIKPHGYAIWEKIQADLDRRFKATGHQNAYFPMFIPESFIKREASHVEGFSPELAVVTIGGGKTLEEPYVVRPTSETIIGHFFSKWIKSWRDLPLLINQWANVVRWEMRTRMFLRTTEFLWQEGHTAHATAEEARVEALRMLDVYANFAEECMAMPVIKGVKTQSEKFAGAEKSYCIEAMMQNGIALQAGTSHDLGQNFGRAFDVKFQNRNKELEYVWQTSWGVSTRLIGGLIMTHSDDAGLILPPKLAPIQIAVIPIYRKEEERDEVLRIAHSLADDLRRTHLAVTVDDREEYKPGHKYFHWEQHGVPIRVELGPRDIAEGRVTIKERTASQKESIALSDAVELLSQRLTAMQASLFAAAQQRLRENTVIANSLDEITQILEPVTAEKGGGKFVMAHLADHPECDARMKAIKASIRCIPLLDQYDGEGTCLVTGQRVAQRVVIAKAY